MKAQLGNVPHGIAIHRLEDIRLLEGCSTAASEVRTPQATTTRLSIPISSPTSVTEIIAASSCAKLLVRLGIPRAPRQLSPGGLGRVLRWPLGTGLGEPLYLVRLAHMRSDHEHRMLGSPASTVNGQPYSGPVRVELSLRRPRYYRRVAPGASWGSRENRSSGPVRTR